MAKPCGGAALVAALLYCTAPAALGAQTTGAGAKLPGKEVFAVVNETVISVREYEAALAVAIREKFYHRRPPEDQLMALKREVGDGLVDRALLLAESRRRGIGPDKAKVDGILASYEQRYRDSPRWRENRATLLPELKRELEGQSVLERLEHAVRTGPEPNETQVRSYYTAHPELFTEPEQVRLSVILLKVDPSSPAVAWNKAREEAHAIIKRLANGADFATLARLHSGDASAQNGGDMGYVHRGMLPEGVHGDIDRLKPGMISEPVTVLEGVAIFRLTERREARLRNFQEARKRAGELWRREQADTRWKDLIARLRQTAQITIDETRYSGSGTGQPGSRVETGR